MLRVRALASMLAIVVVAALAQVPPTAAAGTDVHFVQPTTNVLDGLTDVEVAAPKGTTAVRFSMDGIAFTELTDLYSKGTGEPPQWRTATDASWFPPGEHVLKAEADTASGTESATMPVTTHRPHDPPGRTSLDGAWKFAAQSELPAGALDGDRPPATQPGFDEGAMTSLLVPDSFGAVRDKWNDFAGFIGVYRTTMDLDAPDPGERTTLDFESCYWSCRVFVNGEPVGSTTGGYLPSHFDVTDAVHPGSNTVAVVVDSRTSQQFPIPIGFYWNWAGLMQSVYVDRTPPVALTELTAQGSADGMLTLRPSGRNSTGTPQVVHAIAWVDGPDGATALPAQQVTTTLPPGDATGTPVTLHVPQPKLWDLDHPTLYTITLQPTDGAGHQLSTTTGFRDITAHGADLLLNGRPVEDLQGFDRHTDYPGLGRTQPDGLAYRELKRLHDKGFRIFRPAHYPTTPGELEAADELGFLVIEEVNVSEKSDTVLAQPRTLDFGKQQLRGMIRRDRGHPSLLAYSVGNENGTHTELGAGYVRDMVAYGKSLDDTHLYTEVTNHGAGDKAYPYEDLIADNFYAGWYGGVFTDIVRDVDAVQAMDGGKPMLISEYGADGVAAQPGYGKGSEYYQALMVDEHNRLLDHRPHFVGKMYWTSSEFMITPGGGCSPYQVPGFHCKGLLDYWRQPKLAWKVMFSPVRLTASVLQATPGEAQTLHERVSIADVRGHGASGTLLVKPPEGYTADVTSKEFTVEPDGTTVVDVALHGTLPRSGRLDPGMVRAVIDSDTEAMPRLLEVRAADSTTHPASDSFDSTSLGDGWTSTRPDASGWSLTDKPGSLRLTTMPGTEEGADNTAPNLFLRDTTPDLDYTAEAKLEAATTADGQQVGMYAYRDDGNFAKVSLGRVNGHQAVQLVGETGDGVVLRETRPIDATTARVRLVRRGDDYAGEYSVDGDTWYPLGTVTLGGRARIGLQAEAGRSDAPAVATYVDDLSVRTAGGVTVDSVAPAAPPVLGGQANPVRVTVTNGTDHTVPVSAGLGVPDGWAAGSAKQQVPAFSTTNLTVPVTPPLTPSTDTVTAEVTATDATVLGQASADVVTTPAGSQVPIALDAGCTTSPLFGGYKQLTPSDTWNAQSGYGWLGSAPQCRDRGASDALRRDIVTSTSPATLRMSVPTGTHDAYLLVGDPQFASGNTKISIGGQQVVQSGDPVPTGEFRWVHFTVSGGANGADVDVTFSGNPSDYWRFAALVVLPASVPDTVAVQGISAQPPLLGGESNPVWVTVTNGTDATVPVTAALDAPDGWTSTTATRDVAPSSTATIEVAVTPPVTPSPGAAVSAHVTAGGAEVTGTASMLVPTTPAASHTALALDAGCTTSPVLTGYRPLTAADTWHDGADYGWTAAAPGCRDRGHPDPVREDFVTATSATTLRVAVPAGVHDAYLLTGDPDFAANPITIASGGTVLAATTSPVPAGQSVWLHVRLDGGATGSTVDLDISGNPPQFWAADALVVLS